MKRDKLDSNIFDKERIFQARSSNVSQKEIGITYRKYQTLSRSNLQRVKQVTNYDTSDKKPMLSYFRLDTLYFQKMPIEKNCWEVKDKLVYH